ncbi:MAG: glycosyltransferase [Planctomycetota bacterium]
MSAESRPDVSVLMSVHNGMPYLVEATESILAQGLRSWQFVIVNDGSTDTSVDYLDGLTDGRVQIVHQEQRGLAAALNHGIQHCRSDLIARLDSDDVSLPSRLEKQVAYMREHPQVGLLGTQFSRLGDSRAGFPSKLPSQHREIMDALMAGRHAMCHPTIICRKHLLESVGGYWEHPIAQDWDVYLKMGEVSELANLDEVLLHYRIHSSSLNGRKLAAIRHHQRYAAELARRRQTGAPAIDLADYSQMEEQNSWAWRLRERLNEQAMNRYRSALTNILGNKPLLGYTQLGIAATISPSLTRQRIQRILEFRRADRAATPETSDRSTAMGKRA